MTNMFHALSFKNIFFVEIGIICLIFLSSDALQGSSERHYLHFMITAMTKADSFTLRSLVLCDDGQTSHYCNDTEPWKGNIPTVDGLPEASANVYDSRSWYKNELDRLSNCTGSLCSELDVLHVLQRIIGCELEKRPDGSVNLTVFDEYGFDGEDFISFNYDTMQWIDKNPKAKETKEKWDRYTGRNQFIKNYLKLCTDWISTFHNTYKISPDVHVFAWKVPGDRNKRNLTCLATGFYPRDVEMNIRLNRINLGDQTSSGIRPNADETFQKRISVEIDRNHEGSYDCLVTHSSLTEPVSVNWDGKCSNCEPESQWLIGAVFAVIAITVICWYINKKRRSNGKRRSSSSYGAVIGYRCPDSTMMTMDLQPNRDVNGFNTDIK